MSNKVLIKLKDTKKRKFPVIYKHIEEEVNEGGSKYANHVYLSTSKESISDCNHYYKPISKLL